jgi:hypothetical protein
MEFPTKSWDVKNLHEYGYLLSGKLRQKKFKVAQKPHLRVSNWYKTELPIFIRANAINIMKMQNKRKII